MQIIDSVIAETGRVVRVVLVAREQSGGRIQAIQPATERADPDVAALVLHKGPDTIVAQAVRIVRVIAVDCNGAGPRFKAIEPIGVSADPQRAGAVEMQVANG